MKRNIIVGVGAAIFGLLLVSVFTYIELRYTSNGMFMREWAAKGAPSCRFDDCLGFMGRWVRIHEFVMSPSSSLLVGLLVGSTCRAKYWLALLIGVTPIVLIHFPSDVLSVASGLICIVAAWFGAKSAHWIAKRFSAQPLTVATT